MKYVAPILTGLVLAIGGGALTVGAQGYVPLAQLPIGPGGTELPSWTLSSYLVGAIKLLVAAGGALAVLMLIIAGTQYVAAGINPSAKGDAKDRIVGALIGLALVLTSYLILNSIDPRLVQFNLTLPTVGGMPTSPTAITATPTPAAAACPSPNDSSAACCPQGIACKACSGCSAIASVPNKGCGTSVCFLNTSLLSRIQHISGVTGWRITESWPPTVTHLSSCHQNGTCADLNNSGGATDPTTIKKYYDAFRAAGLNVLYESNNCAPYRTAGVTNCKTYPTMTNSSSFHVQ
jgi:hypothetical protein